MCRESYPMTYCGNQGSCCCSFPTLIILILIILQFGKKREWSKGSKVDNGILFVITLFFLSCCNPCRRMGY